jgi:hypothetical protein
MRTDQIDETVWVHDTTQQMQGQDDARCPSTKKLIGPRTLRHATHAFVYAAEKQPLGIKVMHDRYSIARSLPDAYHLRP